MMSATPMPSNPLYRVYGSRVIDEGLPKVKIIERLIADIGVGTKVRLLPRLITSGPGSKSVEHATRFSAAPMMNGADHF